MAAETTFFAILAVVTLSILFGLTLSCSWKRCCGTGSRKRKIKRMVTKRARHNDDGHKSFKTVIKKRNPT